MQQLIGSTTSQDKKEAQLCVCAYICACVHGRSERERGWYLRGEKGVSQFRLNYAAGTNHPKI